MRRLRALLDRFRPSGSLAERAVAGGAWLGGLTAVQRVLTLTTFAVLARLLSPAAFGVAGIAWLALAGLRRFSRLGLSDALVQRDVDRETLYLDTAWTLSAARGLLIAAVAVALAPLAADIFDAPRLTAVLRALAIVPLVEGLANPGTAHLEKRLAFHRTAAYQLGGTVARTAVSVAAALVTPTVWALVAGSIAGAAVRSALSYAVHPHRPRPRLAGDAARDLLSFGVWLTGSGVVLFALNRGDDAVVGWLLAPAALGIYQQAFRFSNAPATQVTHLLSRIAFPAFSEVNDDRQRLRDGFVRGVRVVSLLAVPMAAGIALVAPAFVRALFGSDWLPMVPVMQVFAAWGLLRALLALCGPLFKAVDRPQYSTAMQATRLVVLAVLLPPATLRWGAIGAAGAVLASGIVQGPLAFAVAVRTLALDPRRVLGALRTPALACLPMCAVVLAIRRALAGHAASLRLAGMIAAGAATYALCAAVCDRLFGSAIRREIATVRESLA